MAQCLSALIKRIRRNPAHALVVSALLMLIGAGLGLVAMHAWAAWQCHLAQRAEEREEYAEAYSHYATALRIWDSRPSTHLAAGRAARRSGELGTAEHHFNRVQELQGGARGVTPELQMERFLLRAQSGEVEQLEHQMAASLDKPGVNNVLILEAMAQGYRVRLRWNASLACLRMLLERDPGNSRARYWRALLLSQMENTTEAIEDLQQVVARRPDYHQARLTLAQLLIRLEPKTAASHFEYLRKHKGEEQDVLIGLAESYTLLGEREKARSLLETMLQSNPKAAPVYLELGSLAVSEGEFEKAEELLRKAQAQNPSLLLVYHQLSKALNGQPGKEAEAKRYDQIVKQKETDYTRLVQIAKKDMNLQPNNPDLYVETGALLLRLGEKATAVKWLHRALTLDPNHQQAHRILMRYHEENGHPEEAAAHRERLLAEPAKTTARPSSSS